MLCYVFKQEKYFEYVVANNMINITTNIKLILRIVNN